MLQISQIKQRLTKLVKVSEVISSLVLIIPFVEKYALEPICLIKG